MREAAILGTLTDIRAVKTRSVVQFIVEVAVEQADEAQAALGGYPKPGEQRWVAIARVDPEAGDNGRLGDPEQPPAKAGKAGGIVQRAALLCKDTQFQEWCGYLPDAVNEAPTAAYVRHHCGVQSRSELAINHEAAHRFVELEREYQKWMKQQLVGAK